MTDGFCQIGFVLNDQHTHALDAMSRRISSAYRKPHTRWQHHAALTGRMTQTSPSARRTSRWIYRLLDSVVPNGVTVFDDAIPVVANLDPDLLKALRQAA